MRKPRATLLDQYALLTCDLLGCGQQARLTIGRLRLCTLHANLYALGREALAEDKDRREREPHFDPLNIEDEQDLDAGPGDLPSEVS